MLLFQLTGPGLNNTLYPSQDSNLSVGSAHSNDGMTTGAGNGGSVGGGGGGGGIEKGHVGVVAHPPVDPSPEKMPHAIPTARTPKERKRKRKNDAQQQQHQHQHQHQQQQQLQGQEQHQNASGVVSGGSGSAEKGVKKINDYFKHTPSSPARPQVTSTSGGGGAAGGGQNSAPGTPTPAPPQGFPQSLYGHHHHGHPPSGALSPVASEYAMPPRFGGVGVGKAVKSVQTDVLDLKELEEELEKKDNRIEELTRMNEELTRQLQVKQKDCDEKGSTITKCLNVVKELLIEKSTIEKKDARAKCMQNRLRLGQFVTQRVGATFQENWTDGFAFQELAKRQEEINNEREEIDRKKKVLQKRKPSEPGTNNRKRASSSNADKGDRNNAGATAAAGGNGASAGAAGSSTMASSSGVSSGSGGTVGLHNGTSSADETLFTKPPPRDGMTLQEYYEAEEILK